MLLINPKLFPALDQALCPNCGDIRENDIYCNHDFHNREGIVTIESLIKTEMTPKVVTLWGQKYYNHTPTLIDAIHGDGQCLMYIVPLATRPDYYILRVDSSVSQMIKDDDDEIIDLVESELCRIIRGEHGSHDEDDDVNEVDVIKPFPALNYSCGCGWGEVEGE